MKNLLTVLGLLVFCTSCTSTGNYFECGTHSSEVSAFTDTATFPPSLTVVPGPLRAFQIAVECDFPYYERFRQGSEERIRAEIQKASVIMERDLGFRVQVVDYSERRSPFYPGVKTATDRATGSGSEVLREFKEEWVKNKRMVARDAALLITWKSGISTGRAYGRTACRPTSAFCYVNYGGDLAIAHELAHVLGVGHDITSQDGHYIMGPSLGRLTQRAFSPRSKAHVAITTPGMTCLEAIEIPAQER